MVRLPQKQPQLGVGYILAAKSPSFFQHGKPKFLVFNFFDLIVNVGREIKKLP